MRAESDVRREIERALPDLRNDEWQMLEEDGWVTDAAVADAPVAGLVRVVKERRRADCGAPRSPRPSRGLTGAHRAAISVLRERDATDFRPVRTFREAHLSGVLIAPEDVGDWIEQRREEPTNWAEGHASEHRLLDFGLPGRGTVCHVSTTRGGVLEDLRALSETLARRYDWRPHQATNFVLTGATPVVPTVRVRVRHGYPFGDRIVLEIDPAEDPEAVAARYRQVRLEAFGPQRRIQEKTARLAEFAFEAGGGTWQERMLMWDARYPEWRYNGSLRTFQRDTTSATAAVSSRG